jgi:hypothetical protein
LVELLPNLPASTFHSLEVRRNKKIQPSCRRRFPSWRDNRGNRLILVVGAVEFSVLSSATGFVGIVGPLRLRVAMCVSAFVGSASFASAPREQSRRGSRLSNSADARIHQDRVSCPSSASDSGLFKRSPGQGFASSLPVAADPVITKL